MAQECEHDVGLLGCGCEGDVYTVYRGVCVECVWCECVCVNLCKCRGNVSVCVWCVCVQMGFLCMEVCVSAWGVCVCWSIR